MRDNIEAFKAHVREAAASPDFIHHAWFVPWHLEIVEKLSLELLLHYPEADSELVELLAWLHDYGKILNFDDQYAMTLKAGPKKLVELGFSKEYAQKAVDYIEILDNKLETDLREAPIEVQIVSSADGCSHLVGPFMELWLYENADKPYAELMQGNQRKAVKDWNYKIVLPEARSAFQARHDFVMEQNGVLPERFFPADSERLDEPA